MDELYLAGRKHDLDKVDEITIGGRRISIMANEYKSSKGNPIHALSLHIEGKKYKVIKGAVPPIVEEYVKKYWGCDTKLKYFSSGAW